MWKELWLQAIVNMYSSNVFQESTVKGKHYKGTFMQMYVGSNMIKENHQSLTITVAMVSSP